MDNKKDHLPSQELTKVISQLLDSGLIAVVITVMRGMETIGSKLLVNENGGSFGSLGNSELDFLAATHAQTFLHSRDETRTIAVKEFAPDFSPAQDVLLLFERLQPIPRLVICGAGHVGAALAKLGSFLGYQVTLIDDRAQFLTRDRFPDEQIELLVAANWADAVRSAIGNGRGVAIAVVTRGHNEDEECMQAIRGVDCDYVGLIGSKRRTNIVIDNLRRTGVAEGELKKIHAPIGLNIGAVSPEEVALAIIAEIVAERHGRKGESLSAWRRAN